MAIEADAFKEANKAGKLNEHEEANDANNKTKVAIETKTDKATDTVEAVKAVEAKADKANDAAEAVDKTVEANDDNEFVVVDDTNELDWIDKIVAADDFIVINKVVLGLLTDFNILTMYVITEVVVALLWWHTWMYAIATND